MNTPPPGNLAGVMAHHWFRHNSTNEMQIVQWNPGSQTYTVSNGHDTHGAKAKDLSGWSWVAVVEHPDDTRERNGLTETILQALKPFVAHVDAAKRANNNDPVEAGQVCRGSVSFGDFERLNEAYKAYNSFRPFNG